MKIFHFQIATIFTLLVVHPRPLHAESPAELRSWEKQLHELNYLIMKTTAVNVIFGLNLSREQALRLRELSRKVDAAGAPVPDMSGGHQRDLVEIRDSFRRLYRTLLAREKISPTIKKRILKLRLREVEIIRKSVLGSRSFGYRGEGCLSCHAPPKYFPLGKVDLQKVARMSPQERQAMDRAHVRGMFGKRGTEALWFLRNDVDRLLTGPQKYLMRQVNCTLLPPDYLAHPTRVGQAILSGEWYGFFREVRAVPDSRWKTYRQLFIKYPFRDLVQAISPGIATSRRKEIVSRLARIVEHARKLDDIDYELEKKNIVAELQREIDGVADAGRNITGRQDLMIFRNAMFLLFTHNFEIYDVLIKKIDSEK